MAQETISPYGSWKSPITAEAIVEEAIHFSGVFFDEGNLFWSELRPQEKGRNVIVTQNRESIFTDLLPQPYNARTTVHEYGGGAVTIYRGVIYFSNFQDQKIYRIKAGKEPESITNQSNMRYADFAIDPNERFIIAIREDHNPKEEPLNTIVRIDLEKHGKEEVLVEGCNFYSSPSLSPDGKRLAWLCWNHPNMPWDGTELWVADLTDGRITGNKKQIAGGSHESIFQPEWSPQCDLYFVSDKTNWWNLYIWKNEKIEPLLPLDAEFGIPQWVFGRKTYTFIPNSNQLVFTFNKNGIWHLGILNVETLKYKLIETPYTTISGICATPKFLYFIGGSPTKPSALVKWDLSSSERTILKWSQQRQFDAKYLSTPVNIEFPTEDGKTAYAWYYPPKNDDYRAPIGELPPLLVKSHGGPTAQVHADLKLGIQFWTSRGFAVLDVNYGGSTGYGREYRNRLAGNWGIVDVNDCCSSAKYLEKKKLVDPLRMAIDGGSAGGYTTLAALTFRGVFNAGASFYGVSDLEALAQETHKFESRYLDQLIGPYPERKDLYQERSPICHINRLRCPIILLQGLEDKVVPPNQAESMFAALKEKRIPTAYIAFENEQHGFRIAENIIKALNSEFYFFSKIFQFVPADPMEPVHIEGL